MGLTLGAKAIKKTNRRIPCELLGKVQIIYSGLPRCLLGESGLGPCILEKTEAGRVAGWWMLKARWNVKPGSSQEAGTQRHLGSGAGTGSSSHWQEKPEPD